MRIGMQTMHQLALSATIITVLFTCGILHARVATATTYYVATTGNDANPGTQSQPFATMTKGISVLQAGDTLYVRAGSYPGYDVNTPMPSGTSWATPITIAGYPGERPVDSVA